MKINNKAMLKESVNIIIAIICIAILISFGVIVYNALTNKHERDQAQAQLNEIVAKINKITKDGGEMNQLYTAPRGWILAYYDSAKVTANTLYTLPRSCNLKSCICICNPDMKSVLSKEAFSKYLKEYTSICDKDKLCSNINIKVYDPGFPMLFDKAPVTLTLANINGEIKITKNE